MALPTWLARSTTGLEPPSRLATRSLAVIGVVMMAAARSG
jgi:hypothetical protein